ncbi:hypothetical protein SE19_04265 [Acidiplasma aeolicum]|jgi:hypothetical protein|uniref:Uncharacterized protein n=2 Tax=Acidiplasma TaxID=507753 RepID=A0A0Q0RUK6_9ARCH|nr:hypothetical protein TZ01_05760 [Acidiplasma sp. MBA-1]KPV46727.1 hypothetical protein SE19_04265 [Acidiplasma aeolicum]KQB33689.1 hypothetical protein AOG55_02290 [Acidiplasma cupricumulans]KQB36531.1 hypothetical protein AOG54_02110 [Acidiplasma aeolicum]
MNLNNFFWLLIKYIIPLAILIYSLIRFNSFLLLISIIWLISSIGVTIMDADIKNNFISD